MEISREHSLEWFFFSSLKNEELTPAARKYVVGVLVSFAKAETAYAGTEAGPPVLVDFLARAQDAEDHQRLEIYRHVGDLTLFVSGVFRESARPNPDYYMNVGQMAYSITGSMHPKRTTGLLFEELADQFRSVSNDLAKMSLIRKQGLDGFKLV